MAALPDLNTLRQAIFDFYVANDAAKLQNGLDVNGMAEWTKEKGLESLNQLLMLQYGKQLDLSKKKSTQDQVKVFSEMYAKDDIQLPPKEKDDDLDLFDNQMPPVEAPVEPPWPESSVEMTKPTDAPAPMKNRESAKKKKHRKSKNRLSNKRDGSEINNNNEEIERKPSITSAPPVVASAPKQNFDELKMKQNLRIFYQKHDPAYLDAPENLDKVIELMYSLGTEAVFSKLVEYYGERVDDVVEEYQREQAEKLKQKGPKRKGFSLRGKQGINDNTDTEEVLDDISAFDDLEMMRANLILYYQKHDPEEIENIDDVIDLGMDVGLAKLNENMEKFYGESLITFLNTTKADKAELKAAKERAKSIASASPAPNPYGIQKNGSKGPAMSGNEHVSKLRTKDPQITKLEGHENAVVNANPPEAPPRNRKPDDKGIGSPLEPRGYTKKREDNMQQLRSDLTAFYTQFDPAKLETMEQIMLLARKLGRQELNLKLITFYGRGIDNPAPIVPTQFTSASGVPAAATQSFGEVEAISGSMREGSAPMVTAPAAGQMNKKEKKKKNKDKKAKFSDLQLSDSTSKNKSPPTDNNISLVADTFLNDETDLRDKATPGMATRSNMPSTSMIPPGPTNDNPFNLPFRNVEPQPMVNMPKRELSETSRQFSMKPRALPGMTRFSAVSAAGSLVVQSATADNSPQGNVSQANPTPIAPAQTYDDVSELRNDLVNYYQKYDPGKFDALDQIVALAKRIGRKKLDVKLKELYGTGLDEFIISLKQAVPASTPPVMPTFQEAFEPPHAPEKIRKQNSRDAMPMGQVPLVMDSSDEGLRENNIVKLKDAGVRVLPMDAPGSSSIKLKKTGRDVTQTLSKPSARGRANLMDKPMSIYNLQKLHQKRSTNATLKLLSVNLESTAESVSPTIKPKEKQTAKVPVNNLYPEEGLQAFYAQREPCDNYRLDMSGATFGVCVCGFNKEAHMKNQIRWSDGSF